MKKLKRKKAMITNILKTVGGLLLLWGIWGVIQMNKPLTIKDIAYDNLLSVVNKFEGYTVYLKENGGYEPYLVLSKNYNGEGDVLLLRKYLLDEPRIYNTDDDKYGAYYENSKIDQFLNSNFLDALEENAKTKIVTSNLEITAKSSIGSVGKETTTIPRQAFILSHTEIAAANSRLAPKEGKKLLYYSVDFHSHIATTKGGEAEPYWLRTPYTEYGITVWGVKSSGYLGNSTLWNMNDKNLFKLSVRPAFCVAKDTKIERKEKIVKGKKVFVLKETSK
ncbi:hypothetical protein GIX45_24930 [Erwinia sp. CPCC 100877]|nr:hypothetical protein [Erwinia sp. CPCC 100877]